MGVVAPMVGALPTAAQAADPVQCNGTITNRTIIGNLVIPHGASCRLDRVTVTGDILTGQFSNLLIMSSTVNGNTMALDYTRPQGAYLNSYNSVFKGSVGFYHAWGAYLDRSSFASLSFETCSGSSIHAKCPGETLGPIGGNGGPNWIYMRNSTVSGNLSWGVGTVTVDDSNLASITVANWLFMVTPLELNRVKVGTLNVSHVQLAMCSSQVTGDARVVSPGMLSVNSKSPTVVLGNPAASCGGNEFRGALSTVDQRYPMAMNANVIRGLAEEVTTWPHDPLPLSGNGNRFLGGTSGAFTVFAQSQGNSTQSLPTAQGLNSVTSRKTASDNGTETLAKVRKASAQAKRELTAKGRQAQAAAERAGKVKFR